MPTLLDVPTIGLLPAGFRLFVWVFVLFDGFLRFGLRFGVVRAFLIGDGDFFCWWNYMLGYFISGAVPKELVIPLYQLLKVILNTIRSQKCMHLFAP